MRPAVLWVQRIAAYTAAPFPLTIRACMPTPLRALQHRGAWLQGLYGCTIATITPADVDGGAAGDPGDATRGAWWANRPGILRAGGAASSPAGRSGGSWASPASLVAAHGSEIREVRW